VDAPSTRDLDQWLTPALVLDLDAVEHNIAAMLARVGDPSRWRPHLKTVKQAVVIDLLLDRGVRQFKVATPDELALALSRADRSEREPSIDVLLAHPQSQPGFSFTRALARAHPRARVQWLADSPAHLDQLAAWTDAPELAVQLDVDLGMGRTGTPVREWLAWTRSSSASSAWSRSSLTFSGLHGYEGHLRWTERAEAHAGYDALIELAQALEGSGRASGLEIVTSGTHAFEHALTHPGLAAGPWRHQVSPGTIVLSDLRSRAAAESLGLRQAAFVAARVISVGAGRVTLDAGSKSITPDGDPPVCAVLDHPELTPLRASEEHLPCRVDAEFGAPALELGALVWLVPDHVCTTVNLHREALWLRGDRLVGRGPVISGHRCSPPES